ncbi:MAG: CorA family divalent cation transporter, partial [Lachnospiraceae bacterium]|nr:CorA family divalent cation transporter [Lachnospiraceae bacterium]
EDKLEHLEEKLLSGDIENFNKQILTIRKELLKINGYYRQLMDMSATLEENQNNLFNEADCKLFSLFETRVLRLFNNTQTLKEYSLQMREMYQSQIDIKQNEIMQFLTIVTTIFMPLTLIVGWYGMNFVYMPELKSPYGYIIIIAISIFIVAVEIWYFKFKKTLN